MQHRSAHAHLIACTCTLVLACTCTHCMGLESQHAALLAWGLSALEQASSSVSDSVSCDGHLNGGWHLHLDIRSIHAMKNAWKRADLESSVARRIFLIVFEETSLFGHAVVLSFRDCSRIGGAIRMPAESRELALYSINPLTRSRSVINGPARLAISVFCV